MAKSTGKTKKTYQFKAELNQLLHLIVHSLYTHPEVFLRELISNASDALNKVRFMQLTNQEICDPQAELKIKIDLDEKKQLFTIEDSGIGMTEDELITNIGTVANSGTLKFLEEIQKKGKKPEGDLIGQFGVGFYSVFMVTDEVIIETQHANPDSKAYRWISDGKGTFTIEEIDRKKRGTTISFRLKDEHKDFAQEYRVKSVIQRYSNFVDFPIQLGKEKINKVEALWRRPKDEIKEDELTEFYKFIANDFEAPLGHLHLSLEGTVNFKALLFIPPKAPLNLFYDLENRGLHLYSNRIFIQDDAKELLPDYLKFVRGVVDTEDLPLNISREVTQHSPVMQKIRSILTTRILGLMEDWSKNDPGKYEKLIKNFGPLFKTGLNSDFANREKILKLLRFESTAKPKGELVSLDDYVSRMKKKQKEIYYITGESRDVIEKNPNLEYFRKNDYEVLLLTDPVDIFIIPSINEYDKKPLKSIEKADIDLEEEQKGGDGKPEETLSSEMLESLIKIFKETLGEKVADVKASKRLVNSPVTLVVGKDGLDPQMERMMKLMNQEVTPQKKILEINPAHPIIKNLARRNIGSSTDPILRKTIMQLYESAMLIEGNLDNPTEYVQRMNELLEEATK
ncbi:MAG TPA: molecular chaperone HtpG [Candidatus Marinimicrobia bacterium]|nr:molecular chaperone HtpG [Candidatus Neomarinimicrobiota bacterium]